MKKKVKAPCAMCLIAKASARIDMAVDACVEVLESGMVQGMAPTEMGIRIHEAKFWKEHLESQARAAGASHKKSCPL